MNDFARYNSFPLWLFFSSSLNAKWFVRWGWMRCNSDGKCFGAVMTSLHYGTKGVWRHVSTSMFKSIKKLRKSDPRAEACLDAMRCTRVGMFLQAQSLNTVQVWATCQREIGLLIGPEHQASERLNTFFLKN